MKSLYLGEVKVKKGKYLGIFFFLFLGWNVKGDEGIEEGFLLSLI